MPNILVNYKVDKKTGAIKICEYGCVFTDKPIAIAQYDYDYEEPIVINTNEGNLIVEKKEYEEFKRKQEELKDYYLLFNEDGTITESTQENKQAILHRLPKDVDLKNLYHNNGEIYMLEDKEE